MQIHGQWPAFSTRLQATARHTRPLFHPWQRQSRQKPLLAMQTPPGLEAAPEQKPQEGTLPAQPQIAAREIELSVSGLQGPECVSKVQAAFDKMPGVTILEADLEGRRLRVSAASDITVGQLMEAVRRMSCGYRAVPYREQSWRWRGHRVNYAEVGNGPPVVLVHGFGGNVHHFRKLAADLSEGYRVLAVDLLGFGDSEKPTGEVYDPHLWQQQVADFIAGFCSEPCVLVGNSIGSQIALYVAAEQPGAVRGVCLLNCAGGMNQKGLYQDDWMISCMRPMFAVVELVLKQRSMAAWLFEKFRSRDRIEQLLKLSTSTGLPPPYANPDAVHDELIDILCRPAYDPGAVDVFVGVFTGNPGPRPESLVERINCPLLDDRPELVAEALLPWLGEVFG
ncbi:hypothetical protein WJX72_012254 [[Myrmecia] bisecta]|uniref:AB hydrolase-1 domain-containing protein n=1 Tax=[Myrmecia] bisecta TaxID=41462 RepID=A0AAW1QGV9_9CHLO